MAERTQPGCSGERCFHGSISGFTLVELLVVIGIIGVLISILLPTIGRANVQAKRVQCQSNLRQLSTYFVLYTGLGKGYFPRPANGADEYDWIYFQPNRNPADAQIPRIAKDYNRNLYVCPADDPRLHPRMSLNPKVMPFSYSVNEKICRIVGNGSTLKVSQVKKPAQKILIICENAESIDDGTWAYADNNGAGRNSLAARHDKRAERTGDPTYGRGTVGFVDGHAEFLERRLSFDKNYWDPGF